MSDYEDFPCDTAVLLQDKYDQDDAETQLKANFQAEKFDSLFVEDEPIAVQSFNVNNYRELVRQYRGKQVVLRRFTVVRSEKESCFLQLSENDTLTELFAPYLLAFDSQIVLVRNDATNAIGYAKLTDLKEALAFRASVSEIAAPVFPFPWKCDVLVYPTQHSKEVVQNVMFPGTDVRICTVFNNRKVVYENGKTEELPQSQVDKYRKRVVEAAYLQVKGLCGNFEAGEAPPDFELEGIQ